MFGNDKKPPAGGQHFTQPIVNVTSHNQSGGITAHTVNMGPQRRDLHSAWGEKPRRQMLNDLPRDKPILVTAILGDTESVMLAQQIHDFLAANKFKMRDTGICQAVMTPPPRGMNVYGEGDGLNFVVGYNG